jgi:predicted N-formylglutamate amidohydrolase
MPMIPDYQLLGADEPSPVLEEGARRGSDFLIVVDHAGARIPRILGHLGLPASELQKHIACDLGALSVARLLAASLDAPLIAQIYSRLVIDCNRDPNVPSSIPAIGENTAIPGNMDLGSAQVEARRAEIFRPYHQRIKEVLDARLAAGRPTILVAQHSMTAVFKGVARAMHAAILYNRDRRFAGFTLEALRADKAFLVADNEPYFVSDATDYTIPVHGEARGLPHVEIEIRQDLILAPAGQQAWAMRIEAALRTALRRFQS